VHQIRFWPPRTLEELIVPKYSPDLLALLRGHTSKGRGEKGKGKKGQREWKESRNTLSINSCA